ncbi:MAG: transketolase [Chloroflexi bacterium]|nr:transketolase [Chloroflexota bacterium]
MPSAAEASIEGCYRALAANFARWEKIKDLIDQNIDIILNYRQSGHPGGSRSKVHALVVTLLSGVMRWDIRHPEKRFGDRFVLVGGHTVPLVYATLALFNEALRARYERTGDPRYLVPNAATRQLTWEDLLGFRRNKGLSGHAEMEGKTLFLKFNTGPSGHGSPVAAGEAFALKRAGATGVKVFAFEGEGGLTPGAAHETMNSAWGLGLDNLYYVVDWNDYGIDDHPISSVVYGTPTDWFGSHGWRVTGTEQGSEWGPVTRAILEMVEGPNPNRVPSIAWVKTRKGRGYGVYDNKSHGVPHPMNSELFWKTKQEFAARYGVTFAGMGEPAPKDPQALAGQFAANLKVVADALRADEGLVDYIADTLVELGDSVPQEIPALRIGTTRNPWKDSRLYDYERYPRDLFVAPGTRVANRAGLAKFGAWINAFGREHYGRALFIASSADLADSTNISGFAAKFGEVAGWGRYNRETNLDGALLPQEITEFANAGISIGMATVNFAENPEEEFQGFYAACSTYGAFVYLKYGLMRLFSQLAQDCQLKLGKVLWVAGHSGPETADDSRTHFGIFSPGVTQLFPDGSVIDLHPWEHNEVPVVLGAALAQPAPIIALHLTRPPIEVPDRAALGMPSHFAAARGAYLIRQHRPDQKARGTVIVQGTSSTANLVKILPELDRAGLNVKVVAAISPQLFRLQPASYQQEVLSEADRLDAMAITSQGRRLMSDWLINRYAEEYALSADWDSRWRTGGTVDEVIEEAHLTPRHILAGIERFVEDREKRLSRIAAALEAAR